MVWRFWLSGSLCAACLLLACSNSYPMGSGGGGGGGSGGSGGGPTPAPAEFNASVSPTLPAGYAISGAQPYEWQAFIRYNAAWVAVGSPHTSRGPAAYLVIDCNDPGIHDACTVHLPGLIQVTVTQVTPSPARLCAYKSGFRWLGGLLLNTPVGTLSLAPVASSSQDPANAGICYP